MKRRSSPALLTAILLISTASLGSLNAATAESTSRQPESFSGWSRDSQTGYFVYYENDGEAACHPADEGERRLIVERDHTSPLEVLGAEGEFQQAAGALNIVLRGTPQLDGFPQAKAAFLRAAAQWSALVQADITVVIDVDFGPTWAS